MTIVVDCYVKQPIKQTKTLNQCHMECHCVLVLIIMLAVGFHSGYDIILKD